MVQVEAGRFNTHRTVAMLDLLKKNKDKQSAYVAGEFFYSDGPTIDPQNFNRFNVFGKYNAALSDRTQLSASLTGFKSKWDASGQIPERAVKNGTISRFGSLAPIEGGNTERYNANLMLAHQFTYGSTWENQPYFVRKKLALYYNFTFIFEWFGKWQWHSSYRGPRLVWLNIKIRPEGEDKKCSADICVGDRFALWWHHKRVFETGSPKIFELQNIWRYWWG